MAGCRTFRTHATSCMQLHARCCKPCLLKSISDPAVRPSTIKGDLGSCTANAIGGAFEFEQTKLALLNWVPSRLFIYYNERVIEGTVNQDSGARLRDGIKSVVSLGTPPETAWPYSTDLTVVTKKPPAPAFTNALKNKVIAYRRLVQNLSQLKGCLAEGYPFVFGFTVYDSFQSEEVAKTGMVPIPNPNTEQQVGGHAVVAVGYDDQQQRFMVRNSWGPEWGMAGYCTMPYAYFTDHQYSSDFWTIRGVTGQAAGTLTTKASAAAAD